MASAAGSILSPLTSLFSFGDKGYLTIDIGSSSIKILEVKGRGKNLRILNAGIAPLSGDIIQDNIIRNPTAVAEAILILVEDQGLQATNVLTVVPGPAVIIKRANFPAQDQKSFGRQSSLKQETLSRKVSTTSILTIRSLMRTPLGTWMSCSWR